MLARPLAEVGAAARRVAEGDYDARVPREGPEELASLADSFNQMATALARQQEAIRRDFIANAAHELRTPLTNLQGYLEALRDGVIAGDAATYESLREEVDRLVRLSRSLDALAEGDAGGGPVEPTEIDLAAHIRTALALAMPTLERAVSSSMSTCPTTCPPARTRTLTQVLANLLSNAARYTPRGGRVTVRAEVDGRMCSSASSTPAKRSRPPTCRGCSSASIGSRSRATRARRRRHRACDRQAAGRGRRRPGRRGVGGRVDPLLVLAARLTSVRSRGGRR